MIRVLLISGQINIKFRFCDWLLRCINFFLATWCVKILDSRYLYDDCAFFMFLQTWHWEKLYINYLLCLAPLMVKAFNDFGIFSYDDLYFNSAPAFIFFYIYFLNPIKGQPTSTSFWASEATQWATTICI